MTEKRIITSARITEMPKSIFDPMPEVHVTYEDGAEENLFSFYPDEIMFVPEDFSGKTRSAAFELFHKRDVEFLRA